MRKIFTLCLASLFFIIAVSVLTIGCGQKNENNTEIESEEKDEYDGMNKAIELEIEKTKDPATGKVPWDKLREAILETDQVKAARRNENFPEALSWIERGSNGDFSRLNGNSRPNNDQTAGRIRAIMVDSLDPTHKTVFAGSVAGGLWKTTDITAATANWVPVNDFMSNLAIADICQDPRPGFQNNMYLCTGESYFNADAVRGVGVFKSTDGGATWNFLTSSSTFLFSTRILCDYQGNIYLGTRGSGLQRSTDGGSTWTNITPTGIGTNVCDLEISSTAIPGRLHVATGISSTSGYAYTDIPSTVTPAGWTSPVTPYTTFNKRSEIAVSGNILYALPCNASDQAPTVWKSIDGGANWVVAGSTPTTVTGNPFANGQAWYDLSVRINPANPDECIIGGIDCAKTTNGGTTWTRISVWVGNSGQYVHADQQNILWWDGGTKLMFACDGGIHYSDNGGTTIRDRNKGLRIKQFYSVAIHPVEANYFIAGAQDNGMHRLNHPGLDSSIEFYGGDGCYSAIDQNEPQYQFGSFVFNVYRRSTTNGASWSTPVNNQSTGRFVNPWDYDNNANIIYACNTAGNYLRWNDPQTGGNTEVVTATGFTGNVSAVHASPYTANRVYFGMGSGGIQYVDNANTGTSVTATNITPAGAAGYANCVVTGSSDQNLMATYSSYGVTNVWVSTNGGTSWTACDGNLPDMPVRWALFHPDTDTKAFIATETGVWETDLLNGASTVWVPNTTFPNVRTDMIKYRASDRTIAAGTHGRGVWSSIIPPVGSSGFTFTNPSPATATCPAPASMDIVLGTIASGGFTNPVTLTASTPPAGTTVSFIPSNVVTPGNSVTVRLNGTNTLPAGSYTITITGTATGATTQTRVLTYTINPGSGPAITAQPSNQTVCAGGNASFSITSASATSFQWQVSTDGGVTYTNLTNGGVYSGVTTSTLTITGATLSLNNNRYRSIATTQCGSTTSNPGILTVNEATAIATQPSNVTSCTGASAQFCVTAVGAGLTYQWQVSATGCGGPFTNIAGATSNCYTIPAVTSGMNGSAYRVVVSGTCAPASVTSNCATLSVATTLSITGQPSNVTVCEGGNASFTVTAVGAATFQWQVSTDGGATYTNVTNGGVYSGATTATLNITGATAAMNNYMYRVNLTSTCGNATSTPATLTVNTLPVITSQPQNASACTGNSVTFNATATGSGLTYQWQVSATGCAGPFVNIPGATSSSYTIPAVSLAQNNTGYRVVVSGTCPPVVTSNCALLTVLSAVTITSNPTSQTICEGSNTSFTVGASGGALVYQWQVSTDGGTTFTNVANGGVYSGATTPTLTLTNVPPTFNNYRYRAIVSNASCTPGTSSAATLTVNSFPNISVQPQSMAVCEGGTATFNVTATTAVGTLSYQWQMSTDGGNTFTNISGATSPSFSLPGVAVSQNNYRFRVIVTAGCGSVTSTAAVLTVNALPVVNFTLPAVLCLSDPALTLTATPAGGTFSGPGVTAAIFNPSLAGLGQKTILYSASNAGCVTTVSRTIRIDECGERHLTLEQIPATVIYPTPNNGRFSIKMQTDLYTKLGLSIYNSMGQLVKSQSFTGVGFGSILPVEMTNVSSGTYHLYLYNNERGRFAKRGVSIVIHID